MQPDRLRLGFILALALFPMVTAHAAMPAEPDGTVRLGPRSVPLPQTISPEARKVMSQPPPFTRLPLEPMRAFMRQFEQNRRDALLATYKVSVEPGMVGKVKINTLLPADVPPDKRNRVLIHIHGGGFSLCDAVCSYSEGIPIAGLTQTKVVSVDYGLAPEHPFPSAVDEALLVYRSVLKSYQPSQIGIFGSSAGAMLSAEVIAKIKQAGLPMPGAMEFLSGTADFAREGDSQSLYDTGGFSSPGEPLPQIAAYLGATAPTDPIASPAYSDLHGFPPTLLMTSTRDLFLSGTVNFERQLHAAGVPTELVVFDGLPHGFWGSLNMPEALEAVQRQADFFDRWFGSSRAGAAGARRLNRLR
jgi:monoterpene epsilon-lactone hydrolase